LGQYGSTHDAQVDTNAPLYLIDNQPCRLLTTRSEANAGRQFYKCPVADQGACNLFQWMDGNEGNWNDYETSNYTPPGGDMLDHHVVNLVNCRNFGLSSFGSGQKEIIENALMLRGVFVLIPPEVESVYATTSCLVLSRPVSRDFAIALLDSRSSSNHDRARRPSGVSQLSSRLCDRAEGHSETCVCRFCTWRGHTIYITPEKLQHSRL
jgi:GRF zinc finger